MCFGRNKSQYNPEDCKWAGANNFCGGFSLNAILNDIHNKDEDPLKTYGDIQGVQRLNESPNSAKSVIETLQMGRGTAFSLPSAICEILNKEKSVFVGYTATFTTGAFRDLLAEETIKIRTSCGPGSVCGESFPDNRILFESIKGYDYMMALVNNCHWLAIKRINNMTYECYDPSKQGRDTLKTKSTIMEAINAHGYSDISPSITSSFISGLIISAQEKIH